MSLNLDNERDYHWDGDLNSVKIPSTHILNTLEEIEFSDNLKDVVGAAVIKNDLETIKAIQSLFANWNITIKKNTIEIYPKE